MRFCLAVIAAVLISGADAAPYKDGDVVVFFGDSITHGGYYHEYITLFYRTRFPDAAIRFVNSGIGGDTAAGAFRRIGEDVAKYVPSHVTFHFGMNDINRSSYLPDSDSDGLIDREMAQERFRQTFPRLVAEVRRRCPDARFTYLTPTPYDDRAIIANPPKNWTGWESVNQVGCNVGLSLMAGFILSAAKRDGADAVNWYTPLNVFTERHRKEDPHFMITRSDRVHPGRLGHFIMACEFLRHQAVPVKVSAIALDAAAQKVVSTENATVADICRSDGGMSFTVSAKALPFPAPAEAESYLAEFDFEDRLNQEVVIVTGLEPGNYVLRIDGTEIGRWSAAAFATGIRLGCNSLTPQYRQAEAVFKRIEELYVREVCMRDLLLTHLYYGGRGAPVDDIEAFSKWFEKNETNKSTYFAKLVPDYLKGWPSYRESHARLWADQKAILDLVRPAPHRYALIPVLPFHR